MKAKRLELEEGRRGPALRLQPPAESPRESSGLHERVGLRRRQLLERGGLQIETVGVAQTAVVMEPLVGERTCWRSMIGPMPRGQRGLSDSP